jgi:hypothetical protein
MVTYIDTTAALTAREAREIMTQLGEVIAGLPQDEEDEDLQTLVLTLRIAQLVAYKIVEGSRR